MSDRVFDGDLAEKAYHEVGHMAAHTFFGHRVASVEVGENFGRCRLAAQTVNPFDYLIACCAGKAAVDKWHGWRVKVDENWRASDDFGKAYKVAFNLVVEIAKRRDT
jgi:hypothetical protein